ncbi:TIGR03668 family PPOX class F420-dependent oxidoreductase [Sphaerisporangium sp. TRM90804]|uniref:TIGR03668 family PPOX class F420-dependent oxidoreductase n=1 Tax=Sphaerisporangium sp. TRM90804 TaxID=3031113 RepID=UPI00244890E6|nr:TIGR03668 family PPOX class F420-dependent oxidoreductase [Sphaerisporangium sp. TRM90804]MDH2425820.1 TIGR03668 family PPOX class F420-dependent oxidoreductase [Sphaerisporangium sp. TRM90804]
MADGGGTSGRTGEDIARVRVAQARVARLATVGADGAPHLVPVTFALCGSPDGDRIVTAVDHKPKTTADLRRLRNIRAQPKVSILVDHYDEDWSALWWVRVDGLATVVEREEERAPALAPLVAKYRQYAERVPAGPVILVYVTRYTSWSSAGSS